MNLLIIGHSVIDHIFDGSKERISPGGIYYSAMGFKAMRSNDDQLFLITTTSKTDLYLFENAFNSFDMKYQNEVAEITHVNLYINNSDERGEHYHQLPKPLKLDESISFENLEGIYINMITGSDLSPEQFVQLREKYNGKIYLDVHTLARGIGKDQHRFFRKIPHYENYLSNINYIQVNEKELQAITPFDSKKEIINAVFNLGVELILITKGEAGTELFSRDGSHFSVDAIKINSINKVGCGDVFGSVFFYSYLSTNDLDSSLILANKAAGIITSYSNEEQFINLKNDII